MLEIMAMEDVAAAVAAKRNQDACRLAGTEVDGIFPSRIVDSGPAAVRKNSKMHQVQMQRMIEIGREAPDLGRVQSRPRVHAIRIERPAVDQPFVPEAAVAEIEIARDHCVLRAGIGYIAEFGWNRGVVVLASDNVEAHDSSHRSRVQAIEQRDSRSHRVL